VFLYPGVICELFTDITDPEVFTKIPLDFFCRCSKSRFLTHLGSFGAEELDSMQV
jgi:redox-regulated HSP33 family molecular chaperone